MEDNIEVKRVITVRLTGSRIKVSLPGSPVIDHPGGSRLYTIIINKSKINDFKNSLERMGICVDIFHSDPDEVSSKSILEKLSEVKDVCLDCIYMNTDCFCTYEDNMDDKERKCIGTGG